jgi:nucleoside-diphosphate-sugar epimerase
MITGAAGRIGAQLIQELSGSHDLRLLDRVPMPGADVIAADLSRRHSWMSWGPWSRWGSARWMQAFQGIEVVIHLAAESKPQAAWPRVLRDNVRATWNVLEAALDHGVRRIVYASSHWVVRAFEREWAPACYTPGGPKIGSDTPPRPLTPYGVSKAFGELAGRMLVDDGRLSSYVAVRIGSYHAAPPKDEALRRRWIGSRDLRTLFRRCLEADFERYHVVYGVSAQPSAYDLSHTRELLSWEPQQVP